MTTKPTAIRCAIYARVSTAGQRERHTIGSQLHLLPEHAQRQGWTIVETYVDDGISADTVEARPAFSRLLDDAAAHAFDVLLMIDLDRVTRSKRSAEGALIYDHLRECGIKLATPDGGLIDLENEDQDLLVGIKRELAKWEKRKMLARTKRGKIEAARKGRRVPGLDPFGLRWVADGTARGGRYEIVPAEALTVRRMYDLAAGGMGANMIAWTLNADGHRTRALKRRSRPAGGAGEWAASSTRKVLRSTVYRGEFVTFKTSAPIVVPVPAIVDAALWERVQVAIGQRTTETKWKHERRYLLSGHARCGVCGSFMWVVNARAGRPRHAYYRCSSTNAWRRMKLAGPCGNRHHRADRADEAVWSKLVDVLSDARLLADACALGEQPEGVDWKGQAEAAKRKVTDLERLVAETLRRQRRGILSPKACDAELVEIAKERKMVDRNLRLAERQMRDAGEMRQRVASIEEQAARLSEGLLLATFEERRALVKLLLPVERGCAATFHADRSIDVQGLFPMPASEDVEMRLTAKAG